MCFLAGTPYEYTNELLNSSVCNRLVVGRGLPTRTAAISIIPRARRGSRAPMKTIRFTIFHLVSGRRRSAGRFPSGLFQRENRRLINGARKRSVIIGVSFSLFVVLFCSSRFICWVGYTAKRAVMQQQFVSRMETARQ